MKIVHFTVTCHWGYTIKVPDVSKAQPAVKLPPPSSIIGAICMPLARRMELGEVIYDGNNIASTVSKFGDMFKAAGARIRGSSSYWEDKNRYLILQFQQPHRRGSPNFMFGAIPTGKIFAPGLQIDLALLVDETLAKEKLGDSWEKELQLAALQISRLGSKESIVSSSNVVIDAANPSKSKVETSYYFPIDAANPIGNTLEQPYHYEEFWEPEWTFGVDAKRIIYIVPGSSSLRP
ncbi:MAG: type I-A CRISPR-associated protein Cas5a, partial [Conexivisphaerales archaeon]